MKFTDNEVSIAKKYIEELFQGSTRILSFCMFHDCSRCFSTTKLYARVQEYHNSELIQNLFKAKSKECTDKL